MGQLLLQGACPETVRQVGSVDHGANLEPSHKAMAKQRLERTAGTTALWRDGTGKLDPSYSFLATEPMLSLVKAGCGNLHVQFGRRTEVSAARCASSDPTAMKLANKPARLGAEPRKRTEGNTGEQYTRRTQSRESVSQRLDCVRGAVQGLRRRSPRWESGA